ncbi:MAG: Uma2 family endonuclease [Saprospiraceae bacterium]
MEAAIAAPRITPTITFPIGGEAVVVRSKMSRERFHAFVLENPDWKIERDKFGTITIHPPMTFDSGYYEGEAFRLLANWSKTNPSGRVFSPSTSFDLPDGSQHKADGAWVSMRKINRLSPEERRSIASIVPEFVMEIRSESDRISTLKKKMTDVWIANGVQLAWLLDPLKQQAWVYRADGTSEFYDNFGHTLSGEDLLPGFSFDLRDLKI